MKPPAKITVIPKITLDDGSIFELLDGETVAEALQRADTLAEQGLKPAARDAAVSDIDYPEDSTARLMLAKDRETAGVASEDEIKLLDMARGKGSDGSTVKSAFVAEALRTLIGRVLVVNAEIKDLQADRREIYQEVKMFGFDVKIVKKVVRLIQIERAAREEEAELTEIYLDAVEKGADGEDIPLPGLPAAKKARKKSQARVKKDAARDAQIKDEKAAQDRARRRAETLTGATP